MTWLLVLMLVGPTLAQGGQDLCDMVNRTSWLIFACLLAVVLSIRNVWAALCVGMIAAGMLTVIPKSLVWQRAGLPALAASAAYLALTPQVRMGHVAPVLWTLVGLGCWVGLWTDYSRQQGFVPYLRWVPRPPRPGVWWTPLCLHEDSPTHLKAGQGNANHLQSVAALCTAATVALLLLGHWTAALAWPLVLQPMLRRVNKENRLGQGHLHLMTLAAVTLGVLSGRLTVLLLLLVALTGALLWWGQPWRIRADNVDGGRFAMWGTIWRDGWRKAGWRQQVFGLGTGTWQPWSAPLTIPKHGGVIFTAAHNEYFQWLVEHGWVGAVLLLAYLTDAGLRLWSGGAEGRALLVVALTLCSVAMTNFPWTWFHEISRPPDCEFCKRPIVALVGHPKQPGECHCAAPKAVPNSPYYVGSPALVAMSLVLSILIEAF